MFEFFKNADNAETDKEFNDATAGLNSIRILSVDSATNAKTNFNFGKELLSILPQNTYKELMIIKEGNQTITFLIREEDAKIKEFVMTIDGSPSPVLIYLEGDNMDLNQISKFSESMNIDGFENLKAVENKK